MIHLTDSQLQGLADGTLRGPEGLAAREHCDGCAACGSELTIYTSLSTQLSALQDPLPPTDFTATVMAAVELREAHLASRRHTLLAALPAAALAVFAVVGWAFSIQIGKIVDGFATARTVIGVMTPVLTAIRVPLGIGAFVVFAIVLIALSRTLRPTYARVETQA